MVRCSGLAGTARRLVELVKEAEDIQRTARVWICENLFQFFCASPSLIKLHIRQTIGPIQTLGDGRVAFGKKLQLALSVVDVDDAGGH